MKLASFLFFIIISSPLAIGQDFEEILGADMERASDFKDYEDDVMDCANYILNNPVDSKDDGRSICSGFIVQWMVGCETTFEIGTDFTDYAGSNTDRAAVYFASLVFAALEDPDKKLSAEEINNRAREVFLDYCADDSNNIKLNKNIKSALKKRG